MNFLHFFSPSNLHLELAAIILLMVYYLLQRQIIKRRQAEVSLRQQTERERLVNQIAQQIRQSLNLEEVLATTVAKVREFLACDRVLIYRLWGDGTGSAITETVLSPYPAILGQTFPEEVFPNEYHQAYAQGKIRTITNIDRDDVETCLAEFVKQFGVKAKLVVPIIQEIRSQGTDEQPLARIELRSTEGTPLRTAGTEFRLPPVQELRSSVEKESSAPHLWGLLIAHQCSQTRQWQQDEIELMKQLATQVAIAIRQSELYQQLQTFNAELECRVRQRTEELAKTNDTLRHTNQTLQSLIAASPRAIFTLDLEDRVKIWNPAAERMFGWSEAEVLDRPNPIISETTVPEYRGIKENVWQGITPRSLEIRRHKKDGSPIDIVFSAAPLTDREGKISGLVAVVADITEQKRQAEQVRLLQSVVVNTNDAILITEAEPIDESGARIIYANEAFTRITGYTLEEVFHKTPRILYGPKTSRVELAKVRAALSRWEPVIVEMINYRKDGSEFWSEFSVVPIADKTGHYTHWIIVQRDITERKRTEEALRRSEERFRSLIENALDIITIVDTDGTIHYESYSVEKVLGYSPTELIGQNFFAFIHPDDLTDACFGITNTMAIPEVAYPIEFRYRHKDGSWRTLEAISQQFKDDAIAPRIVVNSRDITERKRLDQVRLALEREKELSALKTRFFSMASHEFRTPLSTVLAAAQLLENSSHAWDNSEKWLRNLRRIQDSVKNMVQLLDDILTINRAETGKLEFNPQPLDLEQFCRQFVEEMQLNAGTRHTLNFVCRGKATEVCLDKQLLRSILANLLSNAIKYSPNGGRVNCSLTFTTDHVRLQIQDWGVGISPDDQKQLFEPFYRGKNVRHIPGTGLGLVVVKNYVDLHGGSITIASEVNQGTTLELILPRLNP